MDRLHEQQKALEEEIILTKKKHEAQQKETFEAQQRVQAANQEVEVGQSGRTLRIYGSLHTYLQACIQP